MASAPRRLIRARLASTTIALAALACAACVLASAALATTAIFKTGTYRGKTSEGAKFVAKILKTPECDSGKALCFFTITQPEVKTTCPNGESNTVEDFTSLQIPVSGKIKKTVKSAIATEALTMTISRNGTITGSFKITHEPDNIDPEEVTGYCSGSATFTLKRG